MELPESLWKSAYEDAVRGGSKTQWNLDFRLFGEDPLGYTGEKLYEWRYVLFAILLGYYMLESQAGQKWKGD